MRRPFKIYPIENDSIYTNLNDLCRKYMYCPNYLTSTVDLKHKVTLLSSIGIDVDDVVFVCECCNKRVSPLTLSEMRDKKIKRINNE